MIQIEETIIRKLIYHRINIGSNKTEVSDTLWNNVNDEEDEILKKIFLKPFLSNITTYEFKHEINIELNPLFKLSQSIFRGDNFIIQSQNICQHLKTVSKHPNIKDGDLFVIKFDDIKMNNVFYEALGIYKIEKKEGFVETSTFSHGETGIKFKKGIGTKRLDKACLILFTEQPFTILVIDNASVETDYWQNEFIKTNLKNDNVNSTSQFLTMTKSFVTEQLPGEFEVSKADQIDLLNRSVDYFKTHENFQKKEFENNVFHDKEIIKSFSNFNTSKRTEDSIYFNDNFEISQQVVKKQAKVFKSILKLDKNFHIYIHGNKEMLEQGIDESGRKFYKFYYENES